MENAKWWEPDENDILHIPDELDAIFNKVGTQLRFHTISGKSESLTVAHIVRNCQEFFGAELQKQKNMNEKLVAVIYDIHDKWITASHYWGSPTNEKAEALINDSRMTEG